MVRAANTQAIERVVTQGLGGKGPQTDSTTLERSSKVFREEPAQPTAQEADERQSENFIWKLAVNVSELLLCYSIAACFSFLTTTSTFSFFPFTFLSLSSLTSSLIYSAFITGLVPVPLCWPAPLPCFHKAICKPYRT